MQWTHLLACFFGTVFLVNAVPHFVSGVTGRAFQTPFAKPPGQGLSSSTVNVLWAFANIVIGYVLLCRAGELDFRCGGDAAAAGLGLLVMSVIHARLFSRFHGGSEPKIP